MAARLNDLEIILFHSEPSALSRASPQPSSSQQALSYYQFVPLELRQVGALARDSVFESWCA